MMAENEYLLNLSVDPNLRREMAQTNFDLLLQDELAKELNATGKLQVRLETDTKPEKDVVLIILAAGFTTSLVGNAVAKVLRTWLNRQKPGSDGSVRPTFEDSSTYKGKFLGGEFEVTTSSKSS